MRTPPIASLLILAAACSGADDDPGAAARAVEIDTVAGVVHVTNRGPAPATWVPDTARAVRIGVVEGAEPYVFGSITGVWVDPDGRIFVADGKAPEVRVFSADGRFISSFGRDGEGPGEFRTISGIGAAPDGGLAVLDGTLGRVSRFDLDGTFRDSFRLDRPYMMLYEGAPVVFDGAGGFLDVTGLSHGIGVDSVGVIRYTPDGAVRDTILASVDEPAVIMVEKNGRPTMSFPVPFAPRTLTVAGPDGAVWTTSGAAYRVARLDERGDTALVVGRDVEPPRITDAERDSALASARDRYREAAGVEPRDLPDLPDTRPAILDLRVDDDGDLWVLRPDAAAGATWDVFDSDGRLLASLPAPNLRVMHVGRSTLAGVEYDDMDVPRVVVVPLRRGESDRP